MNLFIILKSNISISFIFIVLVQAVSHLAIGPPPDPVALLVPRLELPDVHSAIVTVEGTITVKKTVLEMAPIAFTVRKFVLAQTIALVKVVLTRVLSAVFKY